MADTAIDTSNYVYLCVTAHFWGCSKSARQARSNCRGAGGGRMLEKHGYIIYRVHPDFEVDPVHGDVRTPIGHPAILVEDKRVEKKKQTSAVMDVVAKYQNHDWGYDTCMTKLTRGYGLPEREADALLVRRNDA